MAEKKSQDAGVALNGELWRYQMNRNQLWTSDVEMACLVCQKSLYACTKMTVSNEILNMRNIIYQFIIIPCIVSVIFFNELIHHIPSKYVDPKKSA